MAKFPIDLSRFKKISTNGKNTVLAHPSGHKFIVSHSALSPEHKEELHKLPFAGGGEVKDPTQEHLLPGDKNPNKIEKAVVKEAKGKMADGGVVAPAGPKKYVPSANAPEVKEQNKTDDEVVDSTSSPSLQHTVIKEKVAPRSEGKILGVYAEGGDVEKEPVSTPAETGATGVTGAPTEPAQAPNMPPVESTAAPVTEEAKAEPNPTVDPALARKRELYNQVVGSNPKVPHEPATSFGPNGEAPTQFNRVAWDKANQAFQTEQASKGAAANSATQDAILENKARTEAGLAPLPAPTAPAIPQAAPQQSPTAMGPAGQSSAPGTPQDPYGTNTYQQAFTKGIEEQKQGMAAEGQASAKMGEEQAATLQKAQETQQNAINNYQTHFNNLNQERDSFINDVKNQHIDPNHYLSSLDTAGRISTVIGLIAGGIGAGMTHSENGALRFLNDSIGRDIGAQKDELSKKENLLSANMRQFGNIRDAADMTRVMQTDIVSNQLKEAAAKAQGPLAKARLLQSAGALDQQTAPILSQIAMRKTLIQGAQNGQIPPSRVIDMIVPEHLKGEAQKELKSAQDAGALRANTLDAFDQLAKINTVMGTLNPQTRMKVAALRDVTLDKLTKDTSGRVTPETVKLIGSIFDTKFADEKTINLEKQQLNNLLSQGMHYPILKDYNIPTGIQQQAAPAPEVKTMNGVKYQNTPNGWQRVK